MANSDWNICLEGYKSSLNSLNHPSNPLNGLIVFFRDNFDSIYYHRGLCGSSMVPLIWLKAFIYSWGHLMNRYLKTHIWRAAKESLVSLIISLIHRFDCWWSRESHLIFQGLRVITTIFKNQLDPLVKFQCTLIASYYLLDSLYVKLNVHCGLFDHRKASRYTGESQGITMIILWPIMNPEDLMGSKW